MKKNLLLLITFAISTTLSFSQTTYYWVGGSGTAGSPGAPVTWGAASWNTAADGTGTQRTVSSNNDILVFDGNNALLTVPKTVYVGLMPSDVCGQLKLINGVSVFIETQATTGIAGAGTFTQGSTFGSSVLPINGSGTNFTTFFKKGDYFFTTGYTNMVEVLSVSSDVDMAIANEASVVQSGTAYFKANSLAIYGNPGLTIEAGSSLGFGYTQSGSAQFGAYVVALQPGATGLVNGTFSFLSRGNGAKLVAQDPGSLVFGSGGSCIVNISGGKYYMLGNTVGTGSAQVGGTFAYNTGLPAITFQEGSNFRQGSLQSNTPFGSSYFATSPLVFSPAVSFLPKSNFYYTYTNGYQPYFFSNGASYGNIIWNSAAVPGGTSTTTFFFNPARVDTLTITAMGTPTSPINTGRIPIYGDYINNSTATVNFGTMAFSNTNVVQKISGTNTTSSIGSLYVMDTASVVLAKNVTVVSAVNNIGKLDVGNFTITGSGTSTFYNYGSTNKTYNQPVGSNSASGGVAITAGSTTLQIRGVNSTNPNYIGSTVTSSTYPTAIQPGTIILGYTGGGNFTLSKPATITADSTSTPAMSVTLTNGAATFISSNSGGINGALPSFSTFIMGANAGYSFGTATTTPFPASSASPFSLGNLTLNANVTLNKNVTNCTGILNLNTNILTVNATDSLKLNQANAIAGTFGPTAHINTLGDAGTGVYAVVEMDNIPVSNTRFFPVGNNGYYLPVTVTPSTVSSFGVSVKQGATVDGRPNTAAVADKSNIVDANYIVNRLTGSGNTTLRLDFPASLKGSGFSAIQNYQLGISHYDDPTTTWETPQGVGDNTTNYAIAGFSTFSPFRVAVNLAASPLPVTFGNVTAYKVNGQSRINWTVYSEPNTEKYIVERSVDGRTFSYVGMVYANGNSSYNFTDISPVSGKDFYRVRSVSRDNISGYSNVVAVSYASQEGNMSVSPNPVTRGFFTVKFSKMQAGTVQVKLINTIGQLVNEQVISYNGSNDIQVINLPSNISKGIYHLMITDGVHAQTTSLSIQ